MIRYILDQNVSEAVDEAVRSWNADRKGPPVDTVRVGRLPDLPFGSVDPDILRWAERHGRVVITNDLKTMPGHLADHLAAGGHSPGVFCVRRGTGPGDVAFELAMISDAGDPADYIDAITFIPL